MDSDFIFIPAKDIFHKVKYATTQGGENRNCTAYQIFLKCFLLSTDFQIKVIAISPEMKADLIKDGIIKESAKRTDLFRNILKISDSMAGDYDSSLLRLANMLSIENNEVELDNEVRTVYVISDEPKYREEFNAKTTFSKSITSESALVLLDRLFSEIKMKSRGCIIDSYQT